MTTNSGDDQNQGTTINALDTDESYYAGTELGDVATSAFAEHLSLTRRSFLAGAAGTVASASVSVAQTPSAAFAIEQTAAAVTVHFLNGRCSAPLAFAIPKVYWTARPKGVDVGKKIARPTFTVDDKVAPPQPDGVVRRSATITISRACFAGLSPFNVVFEFTLVGQDCTIGLTTTGWPQMETTRFPAVDFVKFMGGDSAEPQIRVPLQTPFSAAQSEQLIKQVFGNGLRRSPLWQGSGGSLTVDPALTWTLSGPRADAFSMYPGLSGAADKGRLGFGSVRFAPTTPATGQNSGSNQQSPFDKEILTRALPTNISGTETDISTGMSGISIGPLTGAGAIELGSHGGISVTARSSAPSIVGFAQAGDVTKTLSGVLGDFDVAVTGSKGNKSLFLTEGGRIVRYGDGGATGFARLPILDKPFEVTTTHGRFVVEAADPVSPQPGAGAVQPGIVLSTTKNGDLTSFEISALITHASIPFPERSQPPADDTKTKSAAQPQYPVEPQRPFYSRLDFAGGDCTFVLDSLAEPVTPMSARSVVRLGADPNKAAVQLGLDQATLRVVRPADLLSLTFRFSGLALSVGAKSEIVPLRAGACGVHLAEPVNARLRAGEAPSPAFRTGAAVDDRPIMVVEFPPQHVAEQAYLRQIDDGQELPDVALDEETIERHHDDFAALDRYRKGGDVELERRIAARIAIQCAKQAAAIKAAADAESTVDAAGEVADTAMQQDKKTQNDATASADAKAKAADNSRKAADAKVLAENAAKQAANASDNFKAFCERFDVESQFLPESNRWPDDQKIYIGSEWLDLDVRRFARQLAAKLAREQAKKQIDQSRVDQARANQKLDKDARSPSVPPPIDPALREKLPTVDPGDPDFLTWVAAYDKWGDRLFGGLPRYCGPDGIQALVDTGQLDSAGLVLLVAKIAQEIGSPEAFSPENPTEVRLCGPSRIAFRINCDDFEGDNGAIPFTLTDLTNWSRFDLAVVRRAEKLLNFNSAGRLPPHWARSEILDAAATLAHQGINPGRTWLSDPSSASMTAAQRMAEVYASANTPPTSLETAIELPFRLMLSPAQDARWRTPMLLPNGKAPTPLWQASLEDDVSRSSLRAVWSEDFQPDVLRDGTSPTPHGPWAPWDAPVAQADGGPPHSNKRFRAVMDAGDRHELVTLTSVYGLPVIGRRDANTGQLLADGNQIEPPPGYAISGLNQTGDAIYSPRTLNVTELALSALGGSLSLDSHFEPPAGVTLRNQKNPIFQALDVERWRHTAVLGRDISVEIVYKGFLYPLGNRVSFVKLTERRFMRHPHGGPTAYLIQRLFLRIGHPIKKFPALGQANLGRAFPPQTINILTRRTPDLVDPTDRPARLWNPTTNAIQNSKLLAQEYANGAVTFSADRTSLLPGLVFWPRTSSSESGNVRFEVQIDDTGGSISMPMLFVDNAAAHWPDTLEAVAAYYNQDTLAAKRTITHNGTPRRYATESKAGDATFETLNWILKAEGGGGPTGYVGTVENKNFAFSPPLEGADQPPFYPYLETCSIRLNQVGKFTGGPAPLATTRYFFAYLKDGFAPPDKSNDSEVFMQTIGQKLEDLPPMSFGSSGDRAAGIGRPENRIAALSRANGPVGGSKPLPPPPRSHDEPKDPNAAKTFDTTFDPSNFNPANFFGQIGKLLGIIDLGDVIQAVAGLTGQPQLSETIDYYSAQGWDVVRQTILQPLDDTLDTLDKTWTSIAVGTAGENAAQQIAKLFPDVNTTETALRSAVAAALAADAPSVDQQATLIGSVYEKARAFISALERLASDPIGNLQLVLNSIVQEITNTFSDIKTAALLQVEDTTLDFVASKIMNNDAIFNALFAFDQIINEGRLADETRKALNDSLQRFIGDKDTLKSVLQKVRRQNNPLQKAVTDAFTDEVEALKRQFPSDATALQQIERDLKTNGQGELFGQLGQPLAELVATANDITAAAGNAAAAASGQVIVQIIAAVQRLINSTLPLFDLPAFASDACATVPVIVSELLTAIRPGADTVEGVTKLRDCIDDPASCSQSVLATFFATQTIAADLSETLDDLRQLGATAAPKFQTWAIEFRGLLVPLLDRIADQLLTIVRQEPPTANELENAKAKCDSLEFGPLRDLTKKLLNSIEALKALFRSIADVDRIVVEEMKKFPKLNEGDLDNGKTAISAALRLVKVSADLLIREDSQALIDAMQALEIDRNTVFSGDSVPSNIQKKIADEISQVNRASTIGALQDLVTDIFPPARQQQLAGIVSAEEDKILAKAAQVLTAATGLTAEFIDVAKTVVKAAIESVVGVRTALARPVSDALNEFQSVEADPIKAALLSKLTNQLGPALTTFGQSLSADQPDSLLEAESAMDKLPQDHPPTSKDVDDAKTAINAAVKRVNDIIVAGTAVADAIANIAQTVLKGQIAQLIDVDAARREIEALIRDLVPHKATMAYSLDTALTPVGDFFMPDTDRGGGRLTINTVAVIDLTAANPTPQTTVKGVLDPVNIHLFGNAFDVVLLKFKQANFGSAPGSNFNFSIDIEDVVLGEMVQFLQALQSYMTPSDGNGFYLRPASGSPGIEVGYGLNLGTISLGPVSFINVSLNAGCRLPFDNSNALFTISLSRPDSPFLISVGIYGGGGYLALIANGRTIVGFEASFEFGGVTGFSFGPLTGIGRLTLGIFLRKLYDSTTIEGFFFCGGSARIACFGISASLMVSISQQPGGSMYGQAVFTFSFSVGPAHIDFHITVFKTQSKLGGSAAADPPDPPRTRFAELASDLPPIRMAAQMLEQQATAARCCEAGGPRVYAATVSPNRDWSKYRRYFADIKPAGLS